MSIKNIIFDLGGVVFNWKSHKLIEKLFNDPQVKNGIKKHLLEHPDWVDLDRGTLTKEEAIDRTCRRSGLSREIVDNFLSAVPESLTPIEETVDIVKQLHNEKRRLYVLSNMHHEFARFLEEHYDIWDLFVDIVFSCDVLMVKPNDDIYRLILERNQLDPEETLFIDDTQKNLDIANDLGIKTHLFRSADELLDELKAQSLIHTT